MFSLVSLQARNTSKALINFAVTAQRTSKKGLPVTWEAPEVHPSWGPVRSGDLGRFTEPDPTNLLVKYQCADELNDAEPNVRNQFTLGWNNRAHTKVFYAEELAKTVKSHIYDDSSLAVQIAKITGAIRFYYYSIDENHVTGYTRKLYKYRIRGGMWERMHLIRQLRRIDYKQYEWMLEKLDLQYKPKPTKAYEQEIERRAGLKQIATEYCQDIRTKKLESYRKQLHAEKIPYLEQKIKNLQFIREEQRELKLMITIQQEDIDRAETQLNELKAERDVNKETVVTKKWKAF